LQSNWVGVFDNSITNKPGENNQTDEVNQQPMILEYVIIEKTLEEILMDINKQVLETKYIFNLGQLLQVILDIKRYIFNFVPFQHVLSKQVVAAIAIDHQMAMIQVQVCIY